MYDSRYVSPYVYPGLEFRRGRMNAYDFIIECCYEMGLTFDELKSRSRRQDVVWLRHCITYQLRNKEKKTYYEIGKLFNRDHATAMHSCKQWSNFLWQKNEKAQLFNLVVSQVYKRHNFKFLKDE